MPPHPPTTRPSKQPNRHPPAYKPHHAHLRSAQWVSLHDPALKTTKQPPAHKPLMPKVCPVPSLGDPTPTQPTRQPNSNHPCPVKADQELSPANIGEDAETKASLAEA